MLALGIGIGIPLAQSVSDGGSAPSAPTYLRPDGVSQYRRPDGTSLYLRP